MCSVDGIDLVCVESFKGASCFPYCMALHVRGSGTQPLIVHNADEWSDGVSMLKRDCGLFNMVPGTATDGSKARVKIPGSLFDVGAAASDKCTFNPMTVSMVPKGAMKEYSTHASIELKGQPFLFANDVALTAVAGQIGVNGLPTWSIKVQRIYGNQANEFTTIPLNQNIPSLGPCTTPSQCDNVDAQCRSAAGCKAAIPYGYDQTANGHVLGTTTQNFLYWVTNPSLEPFYAFSAYCKNRNSNRTNIFQASVLSSYGGIRLWRMDPYIYCPEVDGRQQCGEQQAVLTKMVQSLDFEDFDESLCDRKFNVMAVDLDYINEQNLALTVLRTTLANVNVFTLRPIDQSQAEYVTLWVNPDTMEQREDELWMPEASTTALAQGSLCPTQRRMPNLGSAGAEAFNAFLFALRLPVNLLLSVPIILQVSGGRCPLLNRGHSVLKTCGSEILSLEDMFNSLYRFNTLFWLSISIVADSFGPGTPQTFLNGLAQVGENQVPQSPGPMKYVHYLGMVDTMSSMNVMAKTLFTLPAPIQAANIALKNPLSSAHYMYRMGSRMIIQLIEATQAKRTVGNYFWNIISDGLKDYDDINLQPMRRTCGGLAIMSGFGTPIGRLVNHWCTGWVEFQKGLMVMASVFFVEIPLMDCLCIRSTGDNFASHVQSTCWPDTPDLWKPFVSTVMMKEKTEVCPDMVGMVQKHFSESLDEMFSRFHAGTREVSSVLDYFVHINYQGDCNSYVDNPYVMTLIPQPVDYFRVCGMTATCRTRCLSEFQAFEWRNLEEPLSSQVTESVKSLFFNSVDDDTRTPLRFTAMMEMYNCTYACGNVKSSGPYTDRCFLVAGENYMGMLEVISYCVPVQLGMNVRRGRQSWTVENLVPGALQSGFVFDLDPINFWESFRLLIRTDTALYVCHGSCKTLVNTADVRALRFTDFKILGRLVVFRATIIDEATMATSEQAFCFSFENYGMTEPVECDSNLWQGSTWPVCLQDEINLCERIVLLPRMVGETLQQCARDEASTKSCTTYKADRNFLYQTSIASAGVLSQSVVVQGDASVWNLFMTGPADKSSHWLSMCKLVMDIKGDVSGSVADGIDAEVSIDVQKKCSIDNCAACRDLTLQKLCYNANNCQIARCIGTMVHLRRPLCSIGNFLAATIEQQMAMTEGAWLIVSETVVTVLDLAGGIKAPDSVKWPDQAFFGHVCAAKDMTSTAISIVTSSINGIVQSVGETPIAQAGQASISNNVFVLFTMTMAATTNFLNQIALAPLYMMMATRKIFVCQVDSILSVVEPENMKVTFGDPAIQQATAKHTGKCMSQYFTENMKGAGSGSDAGFVARAAVERLSEAFASMRMDKLIHPIDALLTYMSGVISGLQDVIQTADRNRCKLPDMSAKDSFNCACGDDAFKITAERMVDSWVTQGHWCSTVMSMLNSDGSPRYVWNPYSLREMEAILFRVQKSGKPWLQEYLLCVATSGADCTPPTASIFERQQVSMISVYQRCLANYQSKQWDMGTHALFNATIRAQFQVTVPSPACFPIPGYGCLGDCVLLAQEQGASNQACFDAYLMQLGVRDLDYFQYEPGASSRPHACQVFSGPAKISGDAGSNFRICLEEYEDAGVCELPHILWSGRSTNKVPVGTDHSTVITDLDAKVQVAKNTYASIQREVVAALNQMSSWTGSNLNVVYFSAEGDILHQFFDCFMMGALDSADMWPGPPGAPKPVWARNEQGTREFELPCSGEKLNDRKGRRDSKSPFTCGSHARRAVMKYFLRDVVSGNDELKRSAIQAEIQKLVADLREAWTGSIDTYMCACPDGLTSSPACCVLDETCDPEKTKCPCENSDQSSYACCATTCKESTFLPKRFQVPFTKVKGSNMLSQLFDKAATYLNSTVWKSNDPWLKYDIGGAEAYNWSTSEQDAFEEQYFDTTKAVRTYEELGYPYRSTTLEMCHGLVSQVYFTMPVKDGGPTTLGTAYDPQILSQSINVTYREEFVKGLVADAFKRSPLFWHYAVRHRPTQSAMCTRRSPVRPSTAYAAVGQATVAMHGYHALKIGGYSADCYCGWWLNSSHCSIPPVVCERLVLMVGSPAIQAACSSGVVPCGSDQGCGGLVRSWMEQLMEAEGGWMGWPCPDMSMSDHWGLMVNKTRWLKGETSFDGIDGLVLVNGTSGLRVGSLAWINETWIEHINPAQRVESVQSLQCELGTPRFLVDHFVDDLFPALQGVRQSAPVSTCLRYSIEVARLTAYQEAQLPLAASDQEAVVKLWRRRCEAKIEQVTFCQVYGLFDLYQPANAACPFTLSGAFPDAVLTSTCMVVYKDLVYDPCLCNSKWCQGSGTLNLFELTDTCSSYHPRFLSVDRVSKRPLFPSKKGETTAVPRALGRSNFRSEVLEGSLKIANNKLPWHRSEGEDFQYQDLVVDWWPDGWKHPVGYHVTVPCTGAAYRTFDSSWAALRQGTTVKMMHVPNTLRNRTLQNNAYGAAGACRTHNYGMPMKVLNSMRFCVQVDERAVDPTVPGSAGSAVDWGAEYCTQSPFDVPWKDGPDSVGTFFNYLVNIIPFSDWGSAGMAPFKYCESDSHCCPTCKCLMSRDGGVCAVLAPGDFECAQHQHCAETMCAGDGICVKPILEIVNNASYDVVIRAHSDGCKNKVDAWGTSKEEMLDDLLESSGMCSYRSWYEHRNLRANCTSSECVMNGDDAWMFSSATRFPESAFAANVLKLQAHPCDRDYEHLENMHSCAPSMSWVVNPAGTWSNAARGQITRTYSPSKVLKVVRHGTLSNTMLGFLGFPYMYETLGYGNALTLPTGSKLRPCSSFGLCAVQASANVWYVHGIREPVRFVSTAGAVRSYVIEDMMQCGSMGFLDAGTCRIDPAVAPLFYLYCRNSATFVVCNRYRNGIYDAGKSIPQLQLVANDLNSVANLMRSTVDSWTTYFDAERAVSQIWANIAAQVWTLSFPSARILHKYKDKAPRNLYFFLTYGAYEVPFAWWWRCSWLSGIAMGPESKPCPAWDGRTWTKGEGASTIKPEAPPRFKTSLAQWLAGAGGVFTEALIDAERNKRHQDFLKFIQSLAVPSIDFACYNQADYYRNATNLLYERQILETVDTGNPWNPTTRYGNCQGSSCFDHSDYRIDATRQLVQSVLGDWASLKPCGANCKCTTELVPKCALAQDNFPNSFSGIDTDSQSETIFMYKLDVGSEASFEDRFDYAEAGCDLIHCCDSNLRCEGSRSVRDNQCTCFRDAPTKEELMYAKLKPDPDRRPYLVFSSTEAAQTVAGNDFVVSSANYVAIDICAASGKSSRCTLGDAPAPDSCAAKSTSVGNEVRRLYCDGGDFSSENDPDEVCSPGVTDAGLSGCFGVSLENKYVRIPDNLNMQVTTYSTPPAQCWTLGCPADGMFAEYDKKITYDKAAFEGEWHVELRVKQVGFEVDSCKADIYYWVEATKRNLCYSQNNEWNEWLHGPGSGCWDFQYKRRNVRRSNVEVWVALKNGEEVPPPKKIASFSSRWCDKAKDGADGAGAVLLSDVQDEKGCYQNSLKTRSGSQEYSTTSGYGGWTLHDKKTYPALSEDKLKKYVTKILTETEDYFSGVKYSPSCLGPVNDTNRVHCSNDKYPQISIKDSGQCTYDETEAEWKNALTTICPLVREAKWFMNEFCSGNSHRERWCQPVDKYNQLCSAKYSSASTKKQEWKFQCLSIVYKGSFGDSCTKTATTCPYTPAVHSAMQENGLPAAGFCPDCVQDSGCSRSKATTTYNVWRGLMPFNRVFPSTPTAFTRTAMHTRHFKVRMLPLQNNPQLGPPKCNRASCSANNFHVELYRGLSVCLPCKLIPPKYCSGQHMCSFLSWNWPDAPLRDKYAKLFQAGVKNSYADVIEGVRANLRSLLPAKADLSPVWKDWLEPYGFETFSPVSLKQGFNDNIESLKGVCASNNNLPEFTKCQNDAPRRALKNFTFATYKTADGVDVPAGHKLLWYAENAQLMKTNIIAWHKKDREGYFTKLFDDEICKSGSIQNLVCYKDGTTSPPTTVTVNPVLSGRFEVQEGCDVSELDSTRVIDSLCNMQACPVPSDGFDRYNTFTGTDYASLGAQTRCRLKNGATAGFLSTPRSFASNLCSVKPGRVGSCATPQGMVGHDAWDGTTVSSLYQRSKWPEKSLPSGLLSGLNPVLKNAKLESGAYGNITLDPWDIGGHYIRMALNDGLKVSGLPLGSYSSAVDAAALDGRVDWLRNWRENRTLELNKLQRAYVMRTCTSWDCPFRRRYFWSGNSPAFRPFNVHPMRSQKMYGSWTHPAMHPSLVNAAFTQRYYTFNGFCLCTEPSACLAGCPDTQASLSDFALREAKVFETACPSQVDWPYTGGTRRDGKSEAYRLGTCGVVGRLPPFLYRYFNAREVMQSSHTTLDEGGDCHMGRPAQSSTTPPASWSQECVLLEKKDTQIVVRCAGANVTLARPKSEAVNVQVKTASCHPFPTFHAPDGTQLPEPEVSYGKLWKWAPSRVLAGDLRFRLCGNDTRCGRLKNVSVEAFWGELMRGGLTDPTSSAPTLSSMLDAAGPDDDGWDAKPWMLCTKADDSETCFGSATKSEWLKDRQQTCSAITGMPNANEAVADLTVCDLDESLDNLCRVIQNARYRLFEANCVLSGSCRISNFFYQPATYSVSNDQLSRQTVQYFYEMLEPRSCPIFDQEVAQIIAQNRKAAQECSAQSLELFQHAINGARQVVHVFVKIIYYMTEIGVNIISLIMTPDPSRIIQQILVNFQGLLNEFGRFFQVIGDMFYKMIMDSGELGKFIRDLIWAICEFVKFYVEFVVKPWACFMGEFVVGLVWVLEIITKVITFGVAGEVYDKFGYWRTEVKKVFDCNMKNPINCEKLFPDPENTSSSLPLPTRCWVGYKPQVGEQKGLGCSASDTCMDDDGEFVACITCSGGVDMNRYGCDPLTKLCRCHTMTVGKTQCSSHQECLLPDTDCGFVDGYLQQSFGFLPCKQCAQQPACLISNGAGTCSCMLKETPVQTCPNRLHSQRVSPDPTKLCLVSLGAAASSSSSYSANYRDLASAACASLNGAQSYCMQVYMGSGSSVYVVVGLSMLRGRRLLAQSATQEYHNWTLASPICRKLMEAGNLTSVLDMHAAEECERWRAIGERMIMMYNVTGMRDVQFTSTEEILKATLPLHVYIHLLQFTEWFQPVSMWIKRHRKLALKALNYTESFVLYMTEHAPIHEHVAYASELMPWFASVPAEDKNSSHAGRRLMGWKDNLEAAKEFTTDIVNDNYVGLSSELADKWLQGPFLWPPVYNYRQREHVCLVGEITWNIAYEALDTTVKVYTKQGPPRPAIDRSLAGSLPQLKKHNYTAKPEPWLVSSAKSFLSGNLNIDLDMVKSFFLSPDYGDTPSPFSEFLTGLVRCDFTKVQHCHGQRRSLVWSALFLGLVFMGIAVLARVMGLPFVEYGLIVLFVPLLLYYVFEYNITCLPMVPTCIFDELLISFQVLLPDKIAWPNELQHWAGCLEGAPRPSGAVMARPNTSECLRSCTEWPFSYQSWEDNLAWAQCDLGYCESGFITDTYQPLVKVVPQPYYDWISMQRYADAIRTKRPYLDTGGLRDAHRICFFFTIFNLVPALLGAVLLLIAAACALSIAIAVIRNVAGLFLNLLALIHSY